MFELNTCERKRVSNGDMLNNMSLEMRRVQQLDKCNHNMCFISRKGVDISSKKDTVSDARGIEVFSPTSMRHLLFTSHVYPSRDLKSVWHVDKQVLPHVTRKLHLSVYRRVDDKIFSGVFFITSCNKCM